MLLNSDCLRRCQTFKALLTRVAAADANFAVVRMFGFSVQQGINNQITPSTDPTKVSSCSWSANEPDILRAV